MVLTADMWVRRRKFGIAKRTDEGCNSAGEPQNKESGFARNVGRNYLRRLEYANSHNDAYEHGGRL
jgi:hypothetical protein